MTHSLEQIFKTVLSSSMAFAALYATAQDTYTGQPQQQASAMFNSLNTISDGALDSAMNQAFGNTAAGEAVPYLSYALSGHNSSDNPEQAANDQFFRSVA